MRAHQLICRASYGPDTLKVLFTAFDDAWESIAGNFGDNPLAIQAARVTLANIMLSLPHSQSSDAEQIKNAALQVMALGEIGQKRRLRRGWTRAGLIIANQALPQRRPRLTHV